MRPILFEVPIVNIPIYGYGAMLFVAFVLCTWLAMRLARREGVPPALFQDLAVWIFVSGLIGARITYLLQYPHRFFAFWQFFALWDGGLVFYGSAIGAVIGYFLVYFAYFRKYGVSTWKIADIIAPCVALGLALGRVGCLLNGCCYGNVACADCPALHFPYSANPMYTMVERGYQTAAGFTLHPHEPPAVARVEPNSPAEAAGMKPDDRIVRVGDMDVDSNSTLVKYLRNDWPRGVNDVELTVRRPSGVAETLPEFSPTTIGLHPTQVYETISMALLLFFLLSYFPFKTQDGWVTVFLMTGYGVHRFLNEMLRTDTDPVAFNMTLSQNISVLVLLAAAGLAVAVWVRHRHGATDGTQVEHGKPE